MGFVENFRNIKAAAGEDFANASPMQKLALGSTAALLAIDIPAHEAIIGMSAGHMYSETDNPIAAGLAGGTASLLVESTLSAGTAISVHAFPKAVDKYRETYLDENEAYIQQEVGSKKEDAAFALAFGSAPLVVKKHANNDHETVSQDLRTGLKAAGFLGAFNTALVSGIAGIAYAGDKLGAESQADTMIAVAKNPLPYLGLFAITHTIKRRKRRHLINEQHAVQTALPEEA